MAKKKQDETIEVKDKKVKFVKPFDGSLNAYKVYVSKSEVGKVLSLPIHIYDWIQKFGVCEDA